MTLIYPEPLPINYYLPITFGKFFNDITFNIFI
jgi:hypothetical protein